MQVKVLKILLQDLGMKLQVLKMLFKEVELVE
jgi:hypothetical protein